MDELIDQITEKTGIPRDAAKQAADVVIAFLKQRLPVSISSQIDTVLGMQVPGAAASQAQEATGGLGHMLGSLFGKKDERPQQ